MQSPVPAWALFSYAILPLPPSLPHPRLADACAIGAAAGVRHLASSMFFHFTSQLQLRLYAA